MKVCFASHNSGKVKELRELVPVGISLVGLDELGISDEIPETGNTLEDNSRIKASFVFLKHGIPVIADDSGLIVPSLNGEPGVFSARYAGPEKDDEKNIELLLRNLEDKKDRSAEFQTVVTYIDDSNKEWQFTGVVKGKIIETKRGTNGFGYDPVFVPDGYNETFAELSSKVKNKISHRAEAVSKFLNHLKNAHD